MVVLRGLREELLGSIASVDKRDFYSHAKANRIRAFISTIALILISCVCSQERDSSSAKGIENADPRPKGYIFSDLFEEDERVNLQANDGFGLGPISSIAAVNRRGDFVILDNYGIRQILVFDHTGRGIAKIGSEGKGDGEYLYPDNVFHQEKLAEYYIYDGDLFRVLIFDKDFHYVYKIDIPLYLEQLAVTDEGRIFCYTSGVAGPQGVDRVVYECDRKGNILNRFCRQSKYSVESKGGGIVIIRNSLYVITPYEYIIRQYAFRGKLLSEKRGDSAHYIPIKRPSNRAVFEDLQKRKEYLSTWSRILQIIRIGSDMIGIVFTEPGKKHVFLDIYDTDLRQKATDIVLPEHAAGPHGLFTHGNCLWMLKRSESQNSEKTAGFIAVSYAFKSDWAN